MPYQKYLQKISGVVAHIGRQRGARARPARLRLTLNSNLKNHSPVQLCFGVLLSLLSSLSWANPACLISFEQVLAAPEAQPNVRPNEGWQAVTLPDSWHQHWPAHQGAVWYQLNWSSVCAPALALSIDRITMAGRIYLNDTLLWQDLRQQEPFSRSWNRPRYWLLPDVGLNYGNNTLWVRVTGMAQDNLGLGTVTLGESASVWAVYQHNEWYQRDLFVFNLVASLVLGFLFFALWLTRRQDSAFGWLALASFTWALFDYTLLAISPWPFGNSADWNRFVASIFSCYTVSFSLFVWRFAGQVMRRHERALMVLLGASLAILWLTPLSWLNLMLVGVGSVFMLVLLANCVQFPFYAWRHRKRHNVMLALCLVMFLLICSHDLLVIMGLIGSIYLYAPLSTPVIMLVMFFVIADRFANDRRRVERFNSELQQAIEATRIELTQTLESKHRLALHNTGLNERLALIHDLHDGLGGSLIRSIALVEKTDNSLQREQFLVLLKELRNDLRQIIDNSSGSGLVHSSTPTNWLAPIRHRFVRLFDELALTSRWHVPEAWPCSLTSRQQLTLARFLEEALTNAVKHSGADCFEVSMSAYDDHGLLLRIKDNGSGMVLTDINQGGVQDQGIGMHSMRARAERMGGRLHIESQSSGTCVSLYLPFAEPSGEQPST